MYRTSARINVKAALLATGLIVLVGSSINSAAYAQFSGRGLPGRREGAGTRGNNTCIVDTSVQVPSGGTLTASTQSSLPLSSSLLSPDGMSSDRVPGSATIATKEDKSTHLVAVIPESNIAATLAAYPTFFWYVPANSMKMGRFTLYDGYGATKKKVYETRLNLEGTPGVVSFKLPADGSVRPLETNRTYYWVFRVFCDPLDRSGDLEVQGFVQRIKPNAELETRLSRATVRERPIIYAASGIWHETLASLVELRQANPNDRSIQADWETLMQTIKLDALTKEAVVPCCRVQERAGGR